MDDRTIIDDDSMRITDVMQAKPGDLMVLGRMEGDFFKQRVFKQRAWLTVTNVHRNGGIYIDVGNIEFFARCGADRGKAELLIEGANSSIYSGLYFDCLIRSKPRHKRGIYKNKHNNIDIVYFDGKSSFIFLPDLVCSQEEPIFSAETFLDFDQYTLVYAFDEDDIHGEKNI